MGQTYMVANANLLDLPKGKMPERQNCFFPHLLSLLSSDLQSAGILFPALRQYFDVMVNSNAQHTNAFLI